MLIVAMMKTCTLLRLASILACGALALCMTQNAAFAAPSAQTAKKGMHFSYVAFPYKRPGSVKASGDRGTYFRDCMANDGNVPEPTPPKPD
jgi:hypothetical protein